MFIELHNRDNKRLAILPLPAVDTGPRPPMRTPWDNLPKIVIIPGYRTARHFLLTELPPTVHLEGDRREYFPVYVECDAPTVVGNIPE